MSEKNWKIKPNLEQTDFDRFPEIYPIIIQLLFNRGIDSQKKIDQFLLPDYGENLHDPFLFNDMKKTVKKIFESIEKKEKIVVYGDYDADGVSSSVILVETLKAFGADVDVYIPFRETEGYGLNIEATKSLVKNKTQLLITVDCGISNKKEIDFLNKNNVEVIVTDHHQEPLELPCAYAILNPHLNQEKYPFKELAGCGVAYKLVQGLIAGQIDYKVNRIKEGFEKWLLDLVAIGTVADMQPLLDENRVMVRYGLIVLQKTRRIGLLKLIEKMNSNLTQIDERVIGWQISPRLNAAGRLNHASSAYELLITDNLSQAEKFSEELNKTNMERQQITEKITSEARQIIGETKDKKLLISVGTGWPTGIVGLVSGRITDEFNLPSLVISRYNGQIIGSGRSIPDFNIIEALKKCDVFLSRYGGHAQACGFTLKDEKNLANFIKKIQNLAEKELAGKEIKPAIEIDADISLEDINWKLFDELEKFKPYGEGNPKPKFLARNLTIVEAQSVGQQGKHLRLMVKHNSNIIRKTIGFCFGGWCAKIKTGGRIDMVFEVDSNEWNGSRELQLKIIDLRITN